MLNKTAKDLKLIGGYDPLPTVEVHADSADEQGFAIAQVVSDALERFAAKNPAARATVYSYGTMSVNFHEAAWSEFLVVAGNAKLLKALAEAFARYPKVKSRYSDYVAPNSARATHHIEEGRVWEAEDPLTWCSAKPAAVDDAEGIASDDTDADDAKDFDDDEDEDDAGDDGATEDGDDEDEDENSDGPSDSLQAQRKGRLNRARADAKVSTIRREIERVFGLPAGSVALCGPDKSRLKGNALIKTLRRRWAEDA